MEESIILFRGSLSAKERQARSRLAKILRQRMFLIGSMVSMDRVCGKRGCKCARGELHPGQYLPLSTGGKRKMIHVPRTLEKAIRQWVVTYQEVWHLMEEVSAACYRRFVQEKHQARRKPP